MAPACPPLRPSAGRRVADKQQHQVRRATSPSSCCARSGPSSLQRLPLVPAMHLAISSSSCTQAIHAGELHHTSREPTPAIATPRTRPTFPTVGLPSPCLTRALPVVIAPSPASHGLVRRGHEEKNDRMTMTHVAAPLLPFA
ncbi:uncharacterized protein LOC123446405 isoform X2 [Hordeum vulgare subsp. vulgare]|uniref:uncharacterized protein LOC123446405 isoform X2 n=1 Tax=Hordeum vulgare subsp. vulgare TaxID=112509 RepID=UPI001D1A4A6B|nr:uncharacterized protein LOC123446405 isoform X2 [Hordeum vulgare subsp. vulgare]